MDTRTIKEIVIEDGRLAALFETLGIDYCCGGNRTLEAACMQLGLDQDEVARAIHEVQLTHAHSTLHYERWDLEFLIDYIVKNHHSYCMSSIVILRQQFAKLQKHFDKFPYLEEASRIFHEAAAELEQHTRKEEMILFPYIRALDSAKQLGGHRPIAPFHTIAGPILRMEDEHNAVGDAFRRIRALLNGYVPHESACATHRATIAGLADFELDLHQHIHLENNILFPSAIRLEEELDPRFNLHSTSAASAEKPACGISSCSI